MLDFLCEGDCQGCRVPGANCNAACRVKECVRTKGVDFCFECAEYPCKDHGLFPSLAAKWRAANDRMKIAGIETWWEEQSAMPRY